MSKISLSPDASGTGIFTIASPNSNTNRTLTLPDDTGTIVTNSGNQAGSFTTLNTSGAVVFNDAGADVDFRVEGDTNANLIFADASADFVGIGTNGPNNLLTVQADATGAFFGDNGVAQIIARGATDSTKRLGLGIDTTNNVGVIQATQVGVDTYPLALNPAGGNVGIGTSSPGNPLVVERAGSVAVRVSNSLNSTALRLEAGTGDVVVGAISNHPLVFRTNDTERMRIDSSGNLLVGGTTQYNSSRLTVAGSISTSSQVFSGGNGSSFWKAGAETDTGTPAYIVYNTPNAGVYLAWNATSWSANSDERLKTSLTHFENAIEKIASLRAGTGRYLSDDESVSRSFLIAQDVQAVLPEAVDVRDDELNTLGLRYTDIIPLLVAAIQELKAELDTVKAELATLKG